MPLHMGSRSDSDLDSDASSDAGSDKDNADLDPDMLNTLVADEGEETSESQGNDDSDVFSEDEDFPTIAWTGYNKKTPVLVFKADAIVFKKPEYRTIAEQYHMSFKLSKTECKILRSLLQAHGFVEAHPNSNDFNIMWTGAHLKPYFLRSLLDYQKVNHFPRSYEITRKDRLFKNIQRMQQSKGFKNFDFIPLSFVVPGEFQEFCSTFLKDKGPWIVKPVASSRGRGVFLVSHPEQVPLDENVIVSKYISNPLLVDGFKFDIRFYVLVTSYDPLLIYLYEEGLTRFATVRYEKGQKSLRNTFMHLTNYSVNKKNEDYVSNDNSEFEDYGNKWSLGAFLRYLRSQGKDTTALMMRVEDVIIKTLLSAELAICTACKMFMPFRGNCFELYGFDVLIDDHLRPWLLEVNLSPSLACDAPLDLKIKTHMLADLFSLAGMTLHDPMTRKNSSSGYRSDSSSRSSRQGNYQEECTTSSFMFSFISTPRPSSASLPKPPGKTTPGVTTNTHLSGEEIRLVRKAREEYQRRGGWIRIFPSPDSWELYSAFLQYPTTHNYTLWQQLYPERAKMVSGKVSTAAFSSSMARAKSVHLHSAQYPQLYISTQPINSVGSKKDDALAQALQRSLQYERRLTALGSKRKKHAQEDTPPPDSNSPQISSTPDPGGRSSKLTQGELNDSAVLEPHSSIDNSPAKVTSPLKVRRPGVRKDQETAGNKTQKTTLKKSASMEDTTFKSRVQSNDESIQRLHTSKSSSRIMQPKETKETKPANSSQATDQKCKPSSSMYNVVGHLEKGVDMSKVQARSAFSAYLSRIYDRIVTASLEQDDSLENSLDLVWRFLKRAAANLRQPIDVTVPSSKLSLNERRRVLSKILGDFISVYNKDTEILRNKQQCELQAGIRGPPNNILEEQKFEKFLFQASEAQLEEVLTTYTRINRSAAIFLGERSHNKGGSDQKQCSAASTPQDERKQPIGGTSDQVVAEQKPRIRKSDLGETDSGIASFGSQSTSAQSSYSSAMTLYSNKLPRSRPSSASSHKSFSNLASQKPVKAFRPASAAAYSKETRERPDGAESEPVQRDEHLSSALQRLTLRQQQRQYAANRSSSLISTTSDVTLNKKSTADNGVHRNTHSSINVRHHSDEGIPVKSSSSAYQPATAFGPVSTYSTKNGRDRINGLPPRPASGSFSREAVFHVPELISKSKGRSENLHFETTPQQLTEHQLRQQHALEASRAKHEAMVAEAHARTQLSDPHYYPKPPNEKKPPSPQRMARVQVLDEISLASKEEDAQFYNGLKYNSYTGTTQKPKMVYSSAQNTGL